MLLSQLKSQSELELMFAQSVWNQLSVSLVTLAPLSG